uniref:MOB-like protein phocein n=1 Tax=Phallusia mammillata TaxID=59560 RepID=A0A6F9DL25_9ASCI|nr:MOB-like protein phocein [Phallusia mammillata]
MVSSGLVMDSPHIVRRNPPGTKREDFYKWPEQSFDEMDSTLVVQQYIQQMIRRDFTDIDAILSIPPGQDEGVWKYEQLRQFCLELNGLAVKLQTECTPDTCSQMTATSQWIFLCAAHKTPKECPAIDYTRHTLDGAACLLNSNKYFPSRVSIRESSVAKLGSVCRRVYRIFSHAYYHHRHIYDEAENETYLCRRFSEFVIRYNLMSQDNLIVRIFDEKPPTNSSNNNSNEVEDGSPSISIAKKPDHEEGPKPMSIASFLNLPEGVVPDPEDDDENAEPIVIDFSSTSVDPGDVGTEADDDFLYEENSVEYSTLKPNKLQGLMDSALSNANNNSNVDSAEDDITASCDSTVIVQEDITVVEDTTDPLASGDGLSTEPVEEEANKV